MRKKEQLFLVEIRPEFIGTSATVVVSIHCRVVRFNALQTVIVVVVVKIQSISKVANR